MLYIEVVAAIGGGVEVISVVLEDMPKNIEKRRPMILKREEFIGGFYHD